MLSFLQNIQTAWRIGRFSSLCTLYSFITFGPSFCHLFGLFVSKAFSCGGVILYSGGGSLKFRGDERVTPSKTRQFCPICLFHMGNLVTFLDFTLLYLFLLIFFFLLGIFRGTSLPSLKVLGGTCPPLLSPPVIVYTKDILIQITLCSSDKRYFYTSWSM